MKLPESTKKAIVFVALASLIFWGSAGLLLPSSSQDPVPQKKASVSSSGVSIDDIMRGEGKEVKAGDVVILHYRGEFEDGRMFDNSYDRGEPFSFTFGAGQVIRGMELGLQGMRVGGTRKITIPSDLGYGAAGVEGVIPPSATLIFTIELLATDTPSENS